VQLKGVIEIYPTKIWECYQKIGYNSAYKREPCTKQRVFEGRQFNGVTEICHRLALIVSIVTKISNSTSNSEVIVICTVCGKRIGQTQCLTEHSLSCYFSE